MTHFPFRAWCRHCVEGRGREFGHVAQGTSGSREAPTVSFDYGFVGDRGEIKNQDAADAAEAKGEGYIKVLVVRDSRS